MANQTIYDFDLYQEDLDKSSRSNRCFTNSWTGRQNFAHRGNFRSKSLANLNPHESSSMLDVHLIRENLLRTRAHTKRKTLKYFSKKQKLTLALLSLIDFMSFCSMSIMAPFFPKEANEKGMSDSLSGFVFSFYALVIFITSPIFGKILPTVGPKPMFLVGILMAGVSNLFFGALEFVDDISLFAPLCFVIRGFAALGASASATASYVFVLHFFPDKIGSVLGILETFVGLGMSIGPAMGGVLYSMGGFGLSFYIIGALLIIIVPLNVCLMYPIQEYHVGNKKSSYMKLLRVPSVLLTGMVIVVVSCTWGFLDPTLEPHLRQFDLSPNKVGLAFLLFSAMYGISSPAWGWLTDRVNAHWTMMGMGLLFCSIGLLLLGPSPIFPFLENSVRMNLVALTILGASVALAILPTFQGLLNSAMLNGCGDCISTYSLVTGVWSCMYSLGEVVGPSIGGMMFQLYGFPLTTSFMAGINFLLAITVFGFTLLKTEKKARSNDSCSSSGIGSTCSSSETSTEKTPLLNSSHYVYMAEKMMCYEKSRKEDKHMRDFNDDLMTDIRGTIFLTSRGSCEV